MEIKTRLLVTIIVICAMIINVSAQKRQGNDREFVVNDYGAVADTAVTSTNAIQRAVDECSKVGGVVIVPRGSYLTGTIYMKSNVTLRLQKGATIYGSKNLKDYPENTPDLVFFRKGIVKRALIYVENCANIAIDGEGTIDGQGGSFLVPKDSKENSYSIRPYVLWMIKSTDIRVEGIKLRNSSHWMQHYLDCDNLYIRNISIFNHCNKNNDMIDIDGCHNVRVSDVTGDSDDDGITFKSTTGRGNENVVITNCIISSHCNAIKIGTESSSSFRNIAITNIIVRPSVVSDKSINGTPRGHTGIALETVDGGDIDGVIISNIRIDGVVCPIFIRRGFRARAYFEGQTIEKPGVLKNIFISNVMATGADKIGCSITGISGYPVENITLNNINIEYNGGGTAENITKDVAEKEKSYPEANMFGVLPSFGFYIRHARTVKFADVMLKSQTTDARPAFFLDDVQKSTFNNTTLVNVDTSECSFLVANSSDVQISGTTVTGKTSSFVKLKGDGNKNVVITNNILPDAEKVFTSDKESKVVREFGNIK